MYCNISYMEMENCIISESGKSSFICWSSYTLELVLRCSLPYFAKEGLVSNRVLEREN